MPLCPNLEGRHEFVLRGILVDFKQKLSIAHENVIKAMITNLALSHTKSYNAIDREVVNTEVRRNNEGFSACADNDMPQCIYKVANSMLEHKPSVALEADKNNSASVDVLEHATLATKTTKKLIIID